MKPYLFFDLDETMFLTLEHMVNYINDRHGINSTVYDHIGQNDTLDEVIRKHDPSFSLSWGETYVDVGINFHASIERHQEIRPMKSMPRIVKELSKKYRLVIVTSRQKVGLNVINYLIDKHIPGCIAHTHCVWEHIGDAKFNEIMSKREFIKKISAKKAGFIDDSVHEIMKAEDVLPCFLFDPTNQHKNVPHIPNRVTDWEEIGKIFL
mgnify:CR=1 FL=1|jgi:predicted phosphatase